MEFRTYTLHATLTLYKTEKDQDYHLVLTDSGGNTMIAEIPDPSCVPSKSPFHSLVASARKKFEDHYGIGLHANDTSSRKLLRRAGKDTESDSEEDPQEINVASNALGYSKVVNDPVIVTGVGFFDFIHGYNFSFSSFVLAIADLDLIF